MEASDGAAVGGFSPGNGPRERAGARHGDPPGTRSETLAQGDLHRVPGRTDCGERDAQAPDPLQSDGMAASLESTLVVADALLESSRLAHRFAPIPDPALVALFPEPGIRYDLEQDATTLIGRNPGHNDLVLGSPSVSSRHCQVVVDDDECSLVDLGSSNGTFVNGERIAAPRILRQGDLVTIGRYVFVFVWFRFAHPPLPEVLCYRDLKRLLAKLYPTVSAVQRLLFATNLHGVQHEAGEGASEHVWEDLLERFRQQDVAAKLDTLLRGALRDHPGNRELERTKAVLDNWKLARRGPGLQERINADARNSARVVREILLTHLESDSETDSLSQMLDEVTDEMPPVASTTRPGTGRHPPAPRASGAELPFEVPEDSLVPPPWTNAAGGDDPGAKGGPSLRDQPDGAPETWTVTRVTDSETPPLAPLAPLPDIEDDLAEERTGTPAKSGPIETPTEAGPIETPTEPGPVETPTGAGPIETPTEPGPVETPAEFGPIETRAEVPAEPSSAEPSHRAVGEQIERRHEPAAMVEVLDEAAHSRALAELDELEAHADMPGSEEIQDDDVEEFAAALRGSSRRRYVVGAIGMAAVVTLAVGVFALREEPSEGGPAEQVPGPGQVAPVADSQPDSRLAQVPGERAAEGDAGVAATGRLEDQEAAGEPTSGEAGRGETQHAPETRVAARTTSSRTESIPVVPQFHVINFLDGDGQPVYDASAMAGTGAWDEETSQVLGSALTNCTWLEGRTKKLANKASRLFLYISCEAGGKAVEGWVYNRAMRRR